jgi:two-component system response regulator
MTALAPIRPIEILLVEDSPTDVLMTREALSQAKVMNHLHVVDDGVAALAFLRGKPPYADKPRPDMILLDLNLPKKNGQEVLAEIKADETLRVIPVVILTTSKADEDILKAYGLHANCYITKPVNFASFTAVVRSIESFWFSVVTLPYDNANT